MMNGRHSEPQRLIVVIVFVCVCLSACGGGDDVIPPFTLNDAVAVADLNGDGYLDVTLVTTHISGSPPHPGRVLVYMQDTAHPSAFLAPSRHAVGSDPWHVAIADLNADGRRDIVVANTRSNDVSVLLQDAANPGSFLAAAHYACGTYTNAVAIGDLNGDGRPDIAAAITGGAVLLFQDPANAGGFLPGIKLSTPSGASSAAIGDLNGDGRADIALTGPDTVFIFMQDPIISGSFPRAVTYPAGPRASAAALSDVDGDGRTDLVVVNAGTSDSGANSSITVRLQDPGNPGTFPVPVNYPSANGARSVAAGDLNNDGRPDIAVAAVVYASQAPGVVQVFLQDPGSPGIFLPPRSYSAGNTPQSIAIGDLNGDGYADMVSNDGPIVLFQDPTRPGNFSGGVITVR